MKIPSEITVAVTIKNQRFASNLPQISDILESYEGMTIDVTFKRRFNKRSLNQNSYYHGVIVPIWRNIFRVEWGELKDHKQTHKTLADLFNYDEKLIEKTGEIVKITRSTKENTTIQQEDFHRKCRDEALIMFGVVIELPNEEMTMKFDQ